MTRLQNIARLFNELRPRIRPEGEQIAQSLAVAIEQAQAEAGDAPKPAPAAKAPAKRKAAR